MGTQFKIETSQGYADYARGNGRPAYVVSIHPIETPMLVVGRVWLDAHEADEHGEIKILRRKLSREAEKVFSLNWLQRHLVRRGLGVSGSNYMRG